MAEMYLFMADNIRGVSENSISFHHNSTNSHSKDLKF